MFKENFLIDMHDRIIYETKNKILDCDFYNSN